MSMTVRRAIVLAVIVGLLIPSAIISFITLQGQRTALIEQLKKDHARLTEILVLGMQEPLWNLSADAGMPLLNSIMDDERVVRVLVTDPALGTFLQAERPERRRGQILIPPLRKTVVYQGSEIGVVTVEVDSGQLEAALRDDRNKFLLTVAGQLLVSLALILILMQLRVLEPLRRLMTDSRKLAQRELEQPFIWERKDEFGALGRSLETTRQSLQTLFTELESKNQALEADIMVRKQVENQLRISEERYRRLVESTKVIPWEAQSGSWRFSYVGPQAESLLGYPLSMWYQEGFLTSYLHPDDRHFAYQIFGETSPEQSDREFECRLLAADGHNVWVSLVASVLTDKSGEKYLQGYLIDIGARKKVEEQLVHYREHLEELVEARTAALASANNELQAFSYSVSHDLRAPLRTVDGFGQALLEDYGDKLDEQGRDYVHRMRRATQRMGELIDTLLNLARLARSEMHLEMLSLSLLMQSILEELQANEPDRKVEIAIAPEIYVHADGKLLRSAMYNLLSNAWKFTSKAEQPSIEFGVKDAEGRRVYFVRDNGVGFDMALAGKLFGAFQRLHTVQEFEGIGVGLATAQRIIHRHRGEIWAEAEPGKGATFFFTLQASPKTGNEDAVSPPEEA
ncbi:ATP-binding protein [Chitinivorax sp. B]|uniref:ATP-binding protein n=1 Tax=Chitinivorax sp. B TaxID=2502235 RepID=UPI0010F7E7C9|nr:ATP-binding protein [Chitinivorax sp. B]